MTFPNGLSGRRGKHKSTLRGAGVDLPECQEWQAQKRKPPQCLKGFEKMENQTCPGSLWSPPHAPGGGGGSKGGFKGGLNQTPFGLKPLSNPFGEALPPTDLATVFSGSFIHVHQKMYMRRMQSVSLVAVDAPDPGRVSGGFTRGFQPPFNPSPLSEVLGVSRGLSGCVRGSPWCLSGTRQLRMSLANDSSCPTRVFGCDSSF